MKDDDKKVRCKSISLQYSCYIAEELCITTRKSYKSLNVLRSVEMKKILGGWVFIKNVGQLT